MLVTMLLAMAIVVHMVEASFPVLLPGVKLGLANIFGLVAYYLYSAKEMWTINLMRVILASLMRGFIFGTGFWLSVGGVCLSTMMVMLFGRWSKMSIIGIASVSACFHAIGQIVVMMLIVGQIGLLPYLGIMILLGIPTGLFTGFVSRIIVARLHQVV